MMIMIMIYERLVYSMVIADGSAISKEVFLISTVKNMSQR